MIQAITTPRLQKSIFSLLRFMLIALCMVSATIEWLDGLLPAESALQAVVAPGLRRRRAGGPPVLLTMPAYGGTLAAARCLGQLGVSVTMAGESPFAPARWSRYVDRWITCPPVADVEPFFDWLVAFGRREPGHVLYPTCDDLAWLLADRAAILGEFYRLYQPKVGTILSLLDKRSLHDLSLELGIPTLPTAFPNGLDEAQRFAGDVGFPLLLKPRTQVPLTRGKGLFVENIASLPVEYARFVGGDSFNPKLVGVRPHFAEPMLQSFRPNAAENIYSLSGFIGGDEESVSVRAAVKVLQRPRRLGTGLCFQEARVEPSVLDAVVRLCRRVGYFGVFEAEFIVENERYHLIDFNPRFYGQMGFEIARALPLPHLIWLAALGKTEELTEALAKSRSWEEGRGYVYCNRFFFNLMLSLQSLSGWMGEDERQRWQDWLNDRSANSLAFDSIHAQEDRLPAFVAMARDLYLALRHPRSFYRQMIIGP